MTTATMLRRPTGPRTLSDWALSVLSAVSVKLGEIYGRKGSTEPKSASGHDVSAYRPRFEGRSAWNGPQFATTNPSLPRSTSTQVGLVGEPPTNCLAETRARRESAPRALVSSA